MGRLACSALWSVALACVIAAALLASPAALATHERTHRYYVYGTVTDTTGKPAGGLLVEVEVPGASTYSEQRKWTGVTDSSGRYAIQVHLHHLGTTLDDSGLTIFVRIPAVGASATYTVAQSDVPPDQSQDPEAVGWGYTRADFSVTPPPPPPPFRFEDYQTVAIVAGVILAAVFGSAFLWKRGEGGRREARVAQQRQAVTELPGVGRSTAQKLAAAGYSTIPQLARADAAELSQKLGVEESQAKRLIAKASQFGKRSA